MKTKFDHEKIVKLYLEHKNTVKVSKEIGCSVSLVCKVLEKKNIPLFHKASKFEYNRRYFEIIDTEEKAYWLGFLYADGYVMHSNGKYRLKVSLAYKDVFHLEKLKNSLESNVPIVKYQIKKGKCAGNWYCRLTHDSRELALDLKSKGCYQRKSLTLTFPSEEIVPEHLVRHFIRGYFDGDGSVFMSNEKHWRYGHIFPVIHFRFCGTFEFLSKIQSILGMNGRLTHSRASENNVYELAFKRRKRARVFMHYLYDDATIYLDRKYQIFKNNL